MSTGEYSDSSLEEENLKRKSHKHKSKKSHREPGRKHKHSRHSPERSRSPQQRQIEPDPDNLPEDRISDITESQRDREKRHRHRDNHDHRPKHNHHKKIKQEKNSSDEERREQHRERRRNDDRRREARRRRDNDDSQDRAFGDSQVNSQSTNKKEKDQPNFELSGKLTEDTNTYKGVVIKYNQPPEARKPKTRWRLYPFKGDEALPVLYIHRQSAYLLGRDRLVVDIPLDHPSCSKQHAVLQYRLVDFERDDGTMGRKVCPYIIDLGSSNGTFVNNNKIEAQRYVQLLEKDMLKFGFSSREYVLLHEKSKTEEEDIGSD